MSLISRLMEMTRLNDDDDEDYFGPEDDYELDRPVRRNTFSNSRDDMDDEEEEPRPRFFLRLSPKVVPMRRAEVSMIKPTSIEDAREICDFLLAGKAVVLNMEGIHTEIAQRIIDFTSGSCFAISGNLQKISHYIFIITPASVDISGDFQEILSGSFDVPINNGI